MPTELLEISQWLETTQTALPTSTSRPEKFWKLIKPSPPMPITTLMLSKPPNSSTLLSWTFTLDGSLRSLSLVFSLECQSNLFNGLHFLVSQLSPLCSKETPKNFKWSPTSKLNSKQKRTPTMENFYQDQYERQWKNYWFLFTLFLKKIHLLKKTIWIYI